MPVKNLSAAIEFYTGVLGFRVEHLHGDEYAVMRRESVRVGLMRAGPENSQPGQGRFYAFLSGVDAYFQNVEANMKSGGRVIEPLADRPYGLKDFAIRDPDGNRLAFSEES
jgi:predicted enzyme related to lactoylglutathione lyase